MRERTLLEQAYDLLNGDGAKAAVLALAPLASACPASAEEPAGTSRGFSDAFRVDSVRIGEQYGGIFQEGIQYTWSAVESGGPPSTMTTLCIALGPVSGENPYLFEPPPDPLLTSINPGFEVSGSISRPVPAGSKLRVTYDFRATFSGGTVEVFSPAIFGQNSEFTSGVIGFGSPPGVLSSGTSVMGQFETDVFTADSGGGQFFFQMFWVWQDFMPSDTLNWDWCDPRFLKIELVLPPAPPCFGDADGNGVVNFGDITSVLANFGANYLPGTGAGDADLNGVVNFTDVTNVLANFGRVCP